VSDHEKPSSNTPAHDQLLRDPEPSVASLGLRGAFGGALMGLANLVPGISGGTMLLAAGIYPRFINAIAELSTLKFRARSIVLIGTVALAAVLTIVLLAAPTKHLVVHYRWVMYSLFIGLTLGGLPLVYRLVRPLNARAILACVIAFALMAVMAFVKPSGGGASPSMILLFAGGVAGASAMILPGVSGAYLLLLMGLYVPILAAIDQAKVGLLGDGDIPRDLSLFYAAAKTCIPVGLGVVFGFVAVSNAMRLLLDRFPKPTLGALIGLLLGAVVGLWPFAMYVKPEPGFVHKGIALTAEQIETLALEDYPTQFVTPSVAQGAGAFGIVLAGIGLTLLVDRLGRQKPPAR
jgi:putative membrane protein